MAPEIRATRLPTEPLIQPLWDGRVAGRLGHVQANGETHMQPRLLLSTAAAFICGVACSQAPGQWLESATIENPAGVSSDFAEALALDGRLLLVGDQMDGPHGTWSGSAYLFDLSDPAMPTKLAKIIPDEGGPQYLFGNAVDVSDGVAIIGCRWYGEDDSQTGAVYFVDVTDPSNPQQLSVIRGSDLGVNGEFGFSVAIDAGLAVVGVPWEGLDRSGGVFIFDIEDPSKPIELALVKGLDARQWGHFGWSVALYRELLLVGCDYGDGPSDRTGAAYLVGLGDPSRPMQLAKLIDPEGEEGDQFGYSVAISAERALVGARSAQANQGRAILYDIGNPADPSALARYDGGESARLGQSVALWGSWPLIGAPGGNEGAGVALLDRGEAQGGVYLFRSPTGGDGEAFGDSVTLSDSLAMIASPLRYPGTISAFVPCIANFNDDGSVDSRDVLFFLTVWSAERQFACSSGRCTTDLNQDGSADSQDVLLFLRLWIAGC